MSNKERKRTKKIKDLQEKKKYDSFYEAEKRLKESYINPSVQDLSYKEKRRLLANAFRPKRKKRIKEEKKKKIFNVSLKDPKYPAYVIKNDGTVIKL